MGIDFRNPFKPIGDAIHKGIDAGKKVVEAGVDAGKKVVDTTKDVFEGAVDKGKGVVDFVKGPSDDKPFDGHMVDVNGKTYPPGTPLSEIEPKGAGPVVIEVNGIGNHVGQQKNGMNDVARATGAKVVGIHNATEGLVKDVWQSALDKLNKGSNPAADSLANTVYGELQAGRPVHLMAHSQGGLVTARALEQVKQRLMVEDGLTKDQAEQKLSNIKVETFGGASWSYTDGPQYVHYVNMADPVPAALGAGPGINTGKGAVVHRFWDNHERFGDNHSLDKTYLAHRVPFEQARRNDFSNPGQHGL
jgi:hypothetical protein